MQPLSPPRRLQFDARGQDRQAEYLRSYLGKREKKNELSNFDQIVNSNFKKKNNEKAYLHMDEDEKKVVPKRFEKVRKESESERRESGSADKKLNRLFSK